MEPSPGIPLSNSFSALGTIHFHVDGGVAIDLVKSVVEKLNSEGFDSKLTLVSQSIRGPQREDYWKTYDSHTPGTGKREELDYFSTTRLSTSVASREAFGEVLEMLSDQQGIVIEAEQVIGKGSDNINWSTDEIVEYYSSDVGFTRSPTLPIEIHYACDIQKGSRQNPPIDLEELKEISSSLGIRVGGWFLFDDDAGTWAYRSNMFAEGEPREHIFRERIQKQRNELATHLRAIGDLRGFTCEVTALVERSIGVWKTPLKKVQHFKSIQELARWEEDFLNLKNFWVLAPNFLGDVDEDFRRAMVRNFRRNVQYTYFLDSFADVQRLRHFAKSLCEREKLPFIFENIKVVLLNTDLTDRQSATNSLQGEYFIANPPLSGVSHSSSQFTQGYKLRRVKHQGIVGGRAMRSEEIRSIVEGLEPLLTNPIQGLRLQIDNDDAGYPFNVAVIYTDLSSSTKLQEKLGDDAWAKILLEYDFIVANEVSKLGGEVIKNLGDGYLLVFAQPSLALRCAERLQLAVGTHNAAIASSDNRYFIPNQKIALDFGPVSRVTRAHGFDLAGKTLSRCARLIEMAHGSQILMLDSFREMVRASAHEWINNNTKYLKPVEFKGLEGNYEVWEFFWKETVP